MKTEKYMKIKKKKKKKKKKKIFFRFFYVSEVGPSVQQCPQCWKLHKANWEQFRVQCEQSIHPNAFQECENPAELFTSLLYSAAKVCSSHFDKSKAPKQTMV